VKSAAAFALGVMVRAAAIAALVFAAVAIMVTRHWYATGVVILGFAALIGADIARLAQATDRALAQFVDGLLAEGHERPSVRAPAGRLAGAIERALERLGRTRAERQRRMEYVRALIDTVAAAVLVLDETGGIEFANRAARQRLGEAGRLEQLAALGAAATKAIAEAPPGAQTVVTLAGGQRMLASAAVFVADGRRRRMVALQSLSGDLAAVELESWRGLTRILSHEMMNSLTPICSLAEGLPARLPAELAASDVAEALEVIARRASGLMHFVDRYRRVADLPEPTTGVIAAEDLAARLTTLMAALMAERGVAFEARCEAKGQVLVADADLLEQALINLLKNALDAIDGRGGGRVTLGFSAADDAAVIEVADNGPGLDAASAEAAFTPFVTTKAGGHGIGLSLARQIALAHGGRLEHRPVRPRGAAFVMTLPNPPPQGEGDREAVEGVRKSR
jgi:nitrogen fixation/metabolism regulation signal transduction histidine kinase